MTDAKVHEEWKKLCEEHTATRDAHFKAFKVINNKFMAIGQGTSHTNPSDKEMSEFEKTWQAWEDVKNRMSEFVKKNA